MERVCRYRGSSWSLSGDVRLTPCRDSFAMKAKSTQTWDIAILLAPYHFWESINTANRLGCRLSILLRKSRGHSLQCPSCLISMLSIACKECPRSTCGNPNNRLRAKYGMMCTRWYHSGQSCVLDRYRHCQAFRNTDIKLERHRTFLNVGRKYHNRNNGNRSSTTSVQGKPYHRCTQCARCTR